MFGYWCPSDNEKGSPFLELPNISRDLSKRSLYIQYGILIIPNQTLKPYCYFLMNIILQSRKLRLLVFRMGIGLGSTDYTLDMRFTLMIYAFSRHISRSFGVSHVKISPL
jgi:hypothetical protein